MTTPRAVSRPLFFVAAALAALLARAPRASAAEEVLRDEWQILNINGARAGSEHAFVRRLGDGNIETKKDSRLSMRRLDTTVETTTEETTVEKEDGTLVSIVEKSKQSAEETTTRIAFEGGKAKITTETMGTSREAVADVPADLMGPWRAERIPAEAGYPAGKTFDMKVFMQSFGGPQVTHTKVIGPEETEIAPGRKEKLIRLEGTIDGLPITATSWVDKDGINYKTKAVLAGLLFESRRATKEEAGAADDGKTPPTDIFIKTLIISKVLVPHARTLEAAVVRVRPKRPEAALPDLSSERQTVEKKEADGSVVLQIRRMVPPDGAATRPLANPAPELATFLAPSSALQSDDPIIVKAAQEAVGREKDAWKAAQAIERWVDKHVSKKNMGVAAASALEVCKNGEGDCTEHAVLTAAVCRAAGIPSRVVLGLEYLMGIWGGHAWSEVYVAGHWYAIDATNGLGFVDPLHIAVATTALAEGSFGKEQMALVSVVGSVDIEILEATWNGRTLPVADPAAVRVEGNRYVNRLYDIAFSTPEGFAVMAVVPEGLEARLARASGKTAAGGVYEIVVVAQDLDGDAPARPPGVPEIKVDGRTGFAGASKNGNYDAFVASGGVIFQFDVKPGDDGAKKVLEALLATVDLDPAPAPPK